LHDNTNNIRGFGKRFYRDGMGEGRFRAFTVSCKDSDLWIGVDTESFQPSMVGFVQDELVNLRFSLEKFISDFPEFSSSFSPVEIPLNAPFIAKIMGKAAVIAKVGPMAAVAGAFAEHIGKTLEKKFPLKEIVVENGGDIYFSLKADLILAVYAGNSPLSGKIGIKVTHRFTPLGVCTSAGNVGPSFSFGNADAVMISCKNSALSDAYATAFGNRIKTPADITSALELAGTCKEIISAVIICQNQMGISGQFELYPLG